MNCLRCKHNNPATVTYCQKCGQKLDFTADEIAGALTEKAQNERIKTTEFYAKQALFFTILLFVIAITAFIISLGAPDEIYPVPSATNGAKYIELGEQGRWEPPCERELMPIGLKRK
jgi:hypothetical protein